MTHLYVDFLKADVIVPESRTVIASGWGVREKRRLKKKERK